MKKIDILFIVTTIILFFYIRAGMTEDAAWWHNRPLPPHLMDSKIFAILSTSTPKPLIIPIPKKDFIKQ